VQSSLRGRAKHFENSCIGADLDVSDKHTKCFSYCQSCGGVESACKEIWKTSIAVINSGLPGTVTSQILPSFELRLLSPCPLAIQSIETSSESKCLFEQNVISIISTFHITVIQKWEIWVLQMNQELHSRIVVTACYFQI